MVTWPYPLKCHFLLSNIYTPAKAPTDSTPTVYARERKLCPLLLACLWELMLLDTVGTTCESQLATEDVNAKLTGDIDILTSLEEVLMEGIEVDEVHPEEALLLAVLVMREGIEGLERLARLAGSLGDALITDLAGELNATVHIVFVSLLLELDGSGGAKVVVSLVLDLLAIHGSHDGHTTA